MRLFQPRQHRLHEDVDRVLVVDCPEALQIERVMQRSALSREAVQAVLQAQATRAQRRACADALIHNEGLSLDALRGQVLTLARLWRRTK
ncbi:dephospho-CoA kinase [uncultured Limnohabitans sp.]|uniref:dephospho-CoA kinase n=1 Tax=uncultured Limnohabitans sp. TaxID=768543 RepID=UPI002620602B|nr:dephospho-CoA kinase [uncultured Limnohabitans sp.]